MLYGKNSKNFTIDATYNLTEKTVQDLTEIVEFAETFEGKNDKEVKNLRFLTKEGKIDTSYLNQIYNYLKGEQLQYGAYIDNLENIHRNRKRQIVEIESLFKKSDINPMSGLEEIVSKLKSAIYRKYQQYYKESDKPYEKQDDQNYQTIKKQIKDGIKQIKTKEGKYEDTCNTDKSLVDELISNLETNVNGDFVKLNGYETFIKWLNTLKPTDIKKKQGPVTKISQLPKVSKIELIKPKPHLYRKYINRELYIKKVDKNDKKMIDVCCDISGSMHEYRDFRNLVEYMIFKTCGKFGIDIVHSFFEYNILEDFKDKKIKNITDLYKNVLQVYERGGENLGNSVIDKLTSMKHSKNKQPLLFITDGTGSIESDDESEQIQQLCLEKNVDLKFILFSENNDMATIPKNKLIYMYPNKSQRSEEKVESTFDTFIGDIIWSKDNILKYGTSK